MNCDVVGGFVGGERRCELACKVARILTIFALYRLELLFRGVISRVVVVSAAIVSMFGFLVE